MSPLRTIGGSGGSVIISGIANYLGRVRSATKLTMTARLVMPVRSATRILFSPSVLIMIEKSATKITTFSSAVLNQKIVKSGSRFTSIYTGTWKPDQKSATKVTFAPVILTSPQKLATNITQATAVGTHKSYVVTAAVDVGGTGTWNNPTRIQGQEQGTQAGSATYSGGIVLGSARLRGTVMASQNNRAYTIDAVYLRWHYQTVGLPIISDLISQFELGYRINTSPIPTVDDQVYVVSVNEDFLVAGREIRIDNGAGQFIDDLSTPVTWANLALIQPYFHAATIANGLMTYYADAIRLRVEFSDTALL